MKKNKVLYISTPHFLDTDLMLLQRLKEFVEIYYILDISNYSKTSTLLNIKSNITRSGLFAFNEKSNLLPSFFKNYISYRNSYLILRSSKKSYNFTNILLQFQIKKLIWKINPSLIHYNNYVNINYLYPYCLYKIKIPNILTVHDPLAHSGERNSRIEIVKKIMIKNSDRIIVLNSQKDIEFRDLYEIKQQKIAITGLAPITIYRNILKNKYTRIENSILFFGRISPYKGINYLVEAIKIAKKTISDLKVTIAGSGKFDFDTSEILEDSTFNILNRYIENEELVELMNSHSIVVCPYTDATQSGVLMTVFAFNKPVIATRVGNFPEIIKNNVTGLLVPPRDSQKLAEAIIKIFTSSDLINIMENNIKKNNIIGSNTWQTIAEKTYQVYRLVLESK